MIKTFADKRTVALFSGQFVKALPTDVAVRAKRKLDVVDSAAPPGNRLEALRGDRKGQHSIRLHEQWRLCFRWSEGHAYDVEFCDYY